MRKILASLLLLVPMLALGAYNPLNPNGQATMANSQPMAIASNQTAFPVSQSGTWTVTDTKLPASAAAADGLANPTITQIGSDAMLFNGTTWDRQRGNVDTTSGDTGAKTTTFAGATQTNYNARGAMVSVVLGTVTGTSPTLVVQLQFWNGVGWINVGPATTALTASSQVATIFIYPTNTSQAAGVTPANLTTSATQTMAINAALPRLWRLNYTLGGTTPSFTITNVGVEYTL